VGNLLVLNMGLKSIRSIIFDQRGNTLASASRPLETLINGDWVTQNPDEWWAKSLEVINESRRIVGGEIKYITVTASASCLVYVDKDGNPLDNAIMVSDGRAINESLELGKKTEFSKVSKATGLGSDPYLMLPKIMWVKNNQPTLFSKTYKFLSPNDYLIFKLSGMFYTDSFNAKKIHFNEDENLYPVKLLNKLGIKISTLPKVVSPGVVIGFVNSETSKLLNFNDAVKVIITTYDAISSFIGSGPFDEGDAVDVSGTVTNFRVLTRKDNLKPSLKIFNQSFNDWGINIVGGSNNLGGGLIEWVKQCYYINENQPYEVMEKEASESEIGANGLIFLPYLLGERAPLWNNNARGVFFGIERIHTRKDMTRAVFESTGFIIKDLIESIEETGLKINKIRLSGGLARINLISQLKADITGKDIIILDNFETTAVGSAIIAYVGLGVFKNFESAANTFVSVNKIINPIQSNYKYYKHLHNLYKETYLALKDLFDYRQNLMKIIYTDKEESVIENL